MQYDKRPGFKTGRPAIHETPRGTDCRHLSSSKGVRRGDGLFRITFRPPAIHTTRRCRRRHTWLPSRIACRVLHLSGVVMSWLCRRTSRHHPRGPRPFTHAENTGGASEHHAPMPRPDKYRQTMVISKTLLRCNMSKNTLEAQSFQIRQAFFHQ